MRSRGREQSAVDLISRTDVAALLLSLASIGIMALGTLHGGPLLQQLLRYSTTGFDHTTHVSMTLSVYDNQGYAYGKADAVTKKIVYRDFTSYPQGWHLANSIIWRGVDSHVSAKNHPTELLLLYFLTVQLWYGCLIFLFCRFLFMVAEEVLEKALSIAGLYAGMGFAFVAELFLFFGIQQYGFANFLAPMFYLLSLTALLFASLSDNNKAIDKANRFWISGLIISGGISFSWLLAAPVGYILVFLGLISIFSENIKSIYKWFSGNLHILLGSIILVSLAAIQGILQILYSIKVNQLNEDGGIAQTNYIILFALLIIALAVFLNTKSVALRKTFVASLSGSLLLAGAIYMYQFLSAGRQTYYSVKLSFLPFLLLALVSASLFVILAEKLRASVGTFGTIVFATSILVFIPSASNLNLVNLKYIIGSFRNLSPYTASQISDVLVSKGGANGNIIVAKHLNYEEDVITTHFLNMMSRDDTLCERTITWYQISNQNSKLVDEIRTCSKANPARNYYVLVSKSSLTDIELGLSNVRNIKLELTN